MYLHRRDYYEWARGECISPCEGMKSFLDWVDFHRRGSMPENLELILPISKFFQMDMCASCGVLGPLKGLPSHVTRGNLKACSRTGWPRVPVLPLWDEATDDKESYQDSSRKWKKAWKLADKEREEKGDVVCCNDDFFCKDCIIRKGCLFCKQYECGDCQEDTNTPTIFQKWHDEYPDADYEDEYGRRGNCPYQPLDVHRCWRCGRRACQSCGNKCQECNRRVCESCQGDLNTWCGSCRGIIENNDDYEIGPIDRTEYVCRECFDRELHFCGCGEPSYDPYAEESDSESS